MVRGVSVCLLDLISDSQNLNIFYKDIGDAFIQAHTNRKIYIQSGPKFGDKSDPITSIVRTLYGLTTSAAFSELCWKIPYAHLVSYPQSLTYMSIWGYMIPRMGFD